MKQIKRLMILCGGISPEHEISLNSAESVFNGAHAHFSVSLCKICKDGAIEVFDGISADFHSGRQSPFKKGRSCVDVVRLSEILTAAPCVAFSVIHGACGEDGGLQGLLETLNIPFVGSSIMASSVAMDKDITKRLLREAGIRVLDSVTMRRSEAAATNYGDITLKLGGQVFVKPANGGSSIGVSRVEDEASFACAIKEALRFDDKILIERRTSGRELECCVIGNGEFHASGVGEVIPRHPFYSYDAKYMDPDGAAVTVPAALDPHMETRVRNIAIAVAKTLGCQGLARVDLFLENESDIYVNEVATIPEFTVDSMCARLWEASGLSYPALIQRLVELAIERHEQVNRLTYVFEIEN